MHGRGLIIALILSIALNLFLISAGTSAYVFGRHAPALQGAGQGQGLRRAVHSLEPSNRKAFIALLRSNGAKVKPDNRHARALRDQAWSGLATGSETGEVIKQQLAQARALNQASRTTVEDAVVDFGLTLDPSGRQALGQALRPPPRPTT